MRAARTWVPHHTHEKCLPTHTVSKALPRCADRMRTSYMDRQGQADPAGIRARALRKERPLDMSSIPDADSFEWEDPRNERATEERVRRLVGPIGVKVVGIRDVPTEPVRIDLDGVEWELQPMNPDQTYDVPTTVYHRI